MFISRGKIRPLLFFFIIFSFYYSQEIPGCMKEDVENLTYISCGFHTTIMKTADGFQVFGEDANYDGFGDLYYPTAITPANGFNYKGKIIAATLGDQYYNSPRMFILTTEGLYTWGGVNVTLSSSLIPNRNFQKISLPAGILPSDVKKMEASYAALVLLTNTGDVYVLGKDTSLFGDGSTNVTIWHKVNGISKVKFISTADAVIFAYTENGNYYTWGANTFLGDNTATGQKNLPTLMIPPFSGVPKMIVVGAFGTYLVLGLDKRIYALGNNDSGQLGIGTTLNSLNWQTVKATAQSHTSSGYLENITFINTTNNHSHPIYYSGASGAIDANGILYLWGSNARLMISNAASDPQTLPIIPSGFTPGVNKAIYVENGGHITPYVDIKLKKYGYVGHKINGSMGNGLLEDVIGEYDLEHTPLINFCFMAEMDTNQKCDQVNFSLNISESNYTVQWNFGDGSSIETETNVPNKAHIYTNSGTYTVTATISYGNNQSKVLTKIITIPPKPVVDLGPDQIICVGTTVTLDAKNPGATYRWNTGATTQTISVTASGTYSVTVTDANGCTATDEVKVTINPKPVVDLGPDQTICEGIPVVLDAKNPGTTYLWNTGATTQTISVTTSGTYSVTITDTNGCTATDEVKVIVNSKPVVNLGPDQTVCVGTIITLDAKNPGATYLWNTGATTQTINVTISGTYSVTVTNANGCVSTDEVEITVHPKPVVDLGHDQTICQDSSVTLDAKNPGATYLWNTGATTRTITVTTSGAYSVTVTDVNGCTATDEVKVTVNPKPVVDLGPDQIVCEGTIVILDAKNRGATYLWNTGATTQTISVTTSGTYSVTVTDVNGCTATDEVKVIVNSKPVVNLGHDQTICIGTIITLDAKNPSATYQWNTGATTQTISVTTSGIYSVTVTNANGCTATDEVKVIVNPKPVVNLGPDQTVCDGTIVTLDAKNPGATYRWNTGAITRTINVTIPGTYSVTVTDANGCIATDEVKVIVNPKPVVNLGPDQTICEGTAVTLDAKNPGATYLWNTGATTQTISVTTSGTYSVTVTNRYSCSTTSSVKINFNNPFIKEVKVDHNTVEIIAVGIPPLEYSLDKIHWQSSPVFHNLSFKVYNAYVRNASGCISEPYPFGILDVPNVITPNGDGINEVWNLKGLELYPGSSIKIFDRYGKLLVNTKVGKRFAWDGKYLGRNVPTASYWYIIELTDGRKLTGWLVVRNYNEKSR